MTIKRFLLACLAAALCFIGGVAVGKFVLSPPVTIVVIDVDKVVWLLEKYNKVAEELKVELKKIKDWNKNALIDPPPEEEKPTKEVKKNEEKR